MSGEDSADPASARSTRTDYWQSFAAAFAAAIFSFATLPLTPAVFSALLGGLAIWIACVDLERLVIPDLANIAVAVLGLAFIMLETPAAVLVEELSDALMRAIAAGGLLFVVRFAFQRFAGKQGLGLGDVKLMAAGAIILTWGSLPYALVLAAVGAILVVVLRGIRQGAWLDRETEIPFGAFLAPAIWAAFLLEQLYLL
ncbi:MAG: leader peptidase (prepilin peptidase) / N-methyltransferase [Alphaproteobacteria bacterium]|nr:leader peptidase (prepilin peptidase) / N-methyltransferase [Alphaproteobacteria bacterium]